MLSEGDKLPKLTVVDDTGAKVRLADLADEYLVLYFYPKDDTPGCTNEGLQFRDAAKAFAKKKARVVGVSRDSVASHRNSRPSTTCRSPCSRIRIRRSATRSA